MQSRTHAHRSERGWRERESMRSQKERERGDTERRAVVNDRMRERRKGATSFFRQGKLRGGKAALTVVSTNDTYLSPPRFEATAASGQTARLPWNPFRPSVFSFRVNEQPDSSEFNGHRNRDFQRNVRFGGNRKGTLKKLDKVSGSLPLIAADCLCGAK